MELADNIPGLSSSDRIGLTAFGSVLAHLVLVLGISFAAPDIISPPDPLPTMEITLVNTRSDTEPEEAEYLAQASQEGGGDTEELSIAKSPLPLQPTVSESQQVPIARIVSEKHEPVAKPQTPVLTQEQDTALNISMVEKRPRSDVEQPLTKHGLVQSNEAAKERARLSAEISQFWVDYHKRPRHKYLSARTKEYKYAIYMEAWRIKVETVGNLNYPEQAKKEKISGQLILDVELRPDGNIHAINVIRPSGFKILDDAAIRIVQLSAPFDPFPESIREEVDILHITRTWRFVRDGTLTSR